MVVEARVELAVGKTGTEGDEDLVNAVGDEDDTDPIVVVVGFTVVVDEGVDIEVLGVLCEICVNVDASKELGAVPDVELDDDVDCVVDRELVSLDAVDIEGITSS